MGVKQETIRIGTRGSPLALVQARMVEAALGKQFPEIKTEIIAIKTAAEWHPEQGERYLSVDQGGKGQFTKEIEQALFAGKIDCAVHSMKDVETRMPDGLMIGHMLPREDVRDVFIYSNLAKNIQKIDDIPAGITVGTCSVRRRAFLLAKRPDIKVVPFRGNVETRLEKIAQGNVDGTFLAMAGLKRLGCKPDNAFILEPQDMLPAAGQGAVGIQIRQQHSAVFSPYLDALSDRETVLCVRAERAALNVLSGSCHTPIGAYASFKDGVMQLRVQLAALDGCAIYPESKTERVDNIGDAEKLGAAVGAKVKAKAPASLLEQILESCDDRQGHTHHKTAG